MRRAVILALALAFAMAALAGCLDPHRAVVDSGVLARTQLDWSEDRHDGGGWAGKGGLETRYSFSPEGAGPPYPAVLSVFSLASRSAPAASSLLARAEDAVEEAARQEHIELEPGPGTTGTRRLANGLRTSWFVREGTVTQPGQLFDEAVSVRILGEAGHDGRSDTSVVAIGLAQVDRQVQCPILGPCQGSQDTRAWIEMVGDPAGSVGGAVSGTGLVHHLETHA